VSAQKFRDCRSLLPTFIDVKKRVLASFYNYCEVRFDTLVS